MPYYSQRSNNILKTSHYKLQVLFKEVIKYFDISIICGYRNEEDQNKAYANKKSTLKFPRSKHNKYPSKAIDFAPYPIDWNDVHRFIEVIGCIKTIAQQLDIKIKCGGDWTNFKDYPHIELEEGGV